MYIYTVAVWILNINLNHPLFIYSHVQEVEVFKVKASRVDKLQVELNSQRERLEEANRTSAKLKVSRSHKPLLLHLNILYVILGDKES